MTDPRPSIVAAIILHAERVLLVRRNISEGSLSWQFPAGERESGETPFDAAVREVAEEVGLPVTPIVLIGERQHPTTGQHVIYIGCRADTDAARVVDTEELAELVWCDRAAVTEKIPSGLFELVSDYLNQHLA